MPEPLSVPQPSAQTCKKCSLAIVEGHAYELGEDRWHISCFKCFKCDTSLGCNSNFLVLGNGSLVCSSCSYSCKQCHKKIDDLAILTGDQAYCSSCFKCRVCKSKIEDLRYARTSKGLFCMSCHEELIAKKKKHDLKRKQMASLSSSSRPSPSEEKENPVSISTPSPRLSAAISALSTNSDVYSHRSPSSTSILNKQLPPHPGSRGSAASPSLTDSFANALQSSASSATTFDSAHNRGSSSIDNTLQPPAAVPMSSYTQSNTQKSTDTESRLLNSAMPKTSVNAQANTSYDIEEVNDSDDELNLRSVREKLESRFKKSVEEPDGAILDLIESFSAPNTPSTIYNHPAVNGSSASTHQDSQDPSKHDASSYSSRETPILRQESEKFRAQASPNKNILLLSPNQFHDNEFHSANNIENNRTSNGLSTEDIRRPRSAISSPMAKANRQARVVETNDENSTTELPSNLGSVDQSFSTPKKSFVSQQSPPLASPPPRLALPEIPSTPKQNQVQRRQDVLGETSEPRGLGLEGVDLPKARAIKTPTPAVTNLEDFYEENVDFSHAHKSPPSRKTSVRSKLSIKHKRSISNGSGGFAGKLGLFKGRDEASAQKGHTRHVSEGSVNGQAYVTPPLPFTSPMESVSRRNSHARSTSDTNFITSMDSEATKRDLEMRAVKFELYHLDTRRQGLLAENMKLNSEKGRLIEALSSIQKRLTLDTQAKEALSREIQELTNQIHKLKEENESLKDESKQLQESMSRTKEELRELNQSRTSQVFEPHNETFESSNASESMNDDGVEAQKATRLKFWRRPKVTIANTQGHSNQTSGTHLHPANGGMSHSMSSYKLGQNNSQTSINDEQNGARKALSGFVTKSRSTTILDSFVNGASGGNGHGPDVPLLTSTLQRRAIFENEKVPLIITKCIEEVEKRGLDVEGIYRLSGGNSAITAIENAFAGIPANGAKDKRSLAKLNDVLGGDINAVTSALKRYLRKLPDPLIPFALYDAFIRVGQRKSDDIETCNELRTRVLNRLPSANMHAVYMIGKHLNQVNQYNHVNRMNFKNLSVVFAPTIARDATGEKEMADMGPRNEATELLFSNFDTLFSEYAEH
ncbi:hypothetical protein OXX80_004131 [Metschnikowia pulcherrima]